MGVDTIGGGTGSGCGGGGGVTTGGAPAGAKYVVIDLNADLTQDRRLRVAAADLSLTDGGANGDVTIDLTATGVTAGAYGGAGKLIKSATVSAKGRLSAIAEATEGVDYEVPITGTSGQIIRTANAFSLANVGTAGTYGGTGELIKSVTTDAKGRVTSVTEATAHVDYETPLTFVGASRVGDTVTVTIPASSYPPAVVALTGAAIDSAAATSARSIHLSALGGVDRVHPLVARSAVSAGDRIEYKMVDDPGAYKVTINPSGGNTFNGGTSGVQLLAGYMTVRFEATASATDWFVEVA